MAVRYSPPAEATKRVQTSHQDYKKYVQMLRKSNYFQMWFTVCCKSLSCALFTILKLFRHLARLEVSSRHVSAEWGIVYPWLLLHVFLRLASNVSDSSLLWSRHTMKYLLAAAGYTSWTGCCRVSNWEKELGKWWFNAAGSLQTACLIPSVDWHRGLQSHCLELKPEALLIQCTLCTVVSVVHTVLKWKMRHLRMFSWPLDINRKARWPEHSCFPWLWRII